MDKKNLVFVMTGLSIGALTGALGRHAIVGQEVVKGQSTTVPWVEVVNPARGPVVAFARSQMAGSTCDEFERKGHGACNPESLDFKHVHTRRRSVHRVDKFDIRMPAPRGPGVEAWIQNRIRTQYCPKVDALYGEGTCDPETIEYTIDDIATNGAARSLVRLEVPVFCTGITPPVDPEAGGEVF